MSSSCSVRSCDDSALARQIVENGVPVDEYVSSSTPVIVAPTAIGNDDLTWVHLRLCSTTDCEREGGGVRKEVLLELLDNAP